MVHRQRMAACFLTGRLQTQDKQILPILGDQFCLFEVLMSFSFIYRSSASFKHGLFTLYLSPSKSIISTDIGVPPRILRINSKSPSFFHIYFHYSCCVLIQAIYPMRIMFRRNIHCTFTGTKSFSGSCFTSWSTKKAHVE